VFKPDDLDFAPSSNHNFAPNVKANVRMLLPTDPQCQHVLTIARAEIQARGSGPQAPNNAPPALDPNSIKESEDRRVANMQDFFKIAIKGITSASKNKESRLDKEASTAFKDAVAQHQLLFARVDDIPDPTNPTSTIQTVHLSSPF
jgi:hypothetical protein